MPLTLRVVSAVNGPFSIYGHGRGPGRDSVLIAALVQQARSGGVENGEESFAAMTYALARSLDLLGWRPRHHSITDWITSTDLSATAG